MRKNLNKTISYGMKDYYTGGAGASGGGGGGGGGGLADGLAIFCLIITRCDV